MIQILGVFSEIALGMINGIYSVVIKIYNIMIGLINNETMDMSQFESIATTMYVLAGVFILFKVVIAMIQMILNPDLVTDKQAGAGKLITRIVTSLIMLIAFSPNGFIFGYEGLFSRIEDAVIAPDGLINNIINVDLSAADSKEIKSSKQYHSDNDSAIGKIFIDNAYAANATTCYYYRVNESKAIPNTATTTNTRYEITIKDIYKIKFYYNPKNTSGLTQAQGDGTVYYEFSEARIGGENGPKYKNGQSVYYSKLGRDIKVDSSVAKTIRKGNCPGRMNWGGKVWEAKKTDMLAWEPGLHGGTKKLNDLKKAIKNLETTKGWHVIGGNPLVKSATVTDDTMGDISLAPDDPDDIQYLSDVEPKAIRFGQAVASSIQTCGKGSEKDCIEAQQGMFVSKKGNDKIIELVDDNKLDLGFMISCVVGIGLMVYLLFLCVEVLIRRFKLFFLEVLAPIPIISYVDPKDKTFNTWFKMYISTYLDLFIKLISISIAIALIETVYADFWTVGNESTGIIGGTLTKFFYIVAILVFAKILPTMVSKIFNLDSMGGSFKDIMGMAKGAAGFGAGAALGAGAGLVTGFAAAAKAPGMKNKLLAGAGAIGSGMSGLAKGAGSGSKGNIFGGAKDVAALNSKRRSLYAGGITAMDMVKGATLGRVGMDAASRLDRKLEKKQLRADSLVSGGEVFDKMKSNAKDTKLYQNLAGYKDASGNSLLNANEQSKLADIITQGSLMGEESGTDYIREQISSSFGEKGNQLLSVHGNNDLYEAKEAGNIQRAYKEYSSFISNNGDVKEVLADTDYLVNKLGLTEDDLRLLDSNDIEHATARTKLQNKVLNETSNNIKTDISIQKGQPGYKASAAVRDQGKNNS